MMRRKNVVGLIALVAIVAAVIFAGCVEEEATIPIPTAQVEKITEESKQKELLATAVSGNVISIPESWDADAEDDGITVYPGLKNESGKSVQFEGIELPVEIKIYTMKYDNDYNEVRDRSVYTGTGIIDSWKDFHPLYGGESINILFEDIKTVESDDDYGWVYATITLPDGRTVEAVDKGARIKPE